MHSPCTRQYTRDLRHVNPSVNPHQSPIYIPIFLCLFKVGNGESERLSFAQGPTGGFRGGLVIHSPSPSPERVQGPGGRGFAPLEAERRHLLQEEGVGLCPFPPGREGRRPEPLMGSHQGDSVGGATGSMAQRPSGLPWNLMTNRQDPFLEKPRSGRQN